MKPPKHKQQSTSPDLKGRGGFLRKEAQKTGNDEKDDNGKGKGETTKASNPKSKKKSRAFSPKGRKGSAARSRSLAKWQKENEKRGRTRGGKHTW